MRTLSKKAIFLDIDGVMNTVELRKTRICRFHDVILTEKRKLTKDDLDLKEDCVQRIIGLFDEDTDLIVTSMWRFSVRPSHFSELFALYGHQIDESKIDLLRCDMLEFDKGMRAQFIQEYLELYPYEQFVIIDDTPDHFDKFYDRLILTDPVVGFTEKDFHKAINVINKKAIN